MSLEEKTKKWGCYHCSCCRFYHGFAKGCELPRCAYILVSFAQQEIDKLKTFRDNAYKKWCESEDKIKVLLEERGLLKQKLKEKAIRLLQIRAGGRYRMFEAGMLYQCLVLLGMQEYTRHKQVDALVKITCHYFHESDAKKQLEELLK